MFTGLVEELGKCQEIRSTPAGAQLTILSSLVESSLNPGDSVAVNGCCLTVTLVHEGIIQFDLLAETLERTNLKSLESGQLVNLERALPANGRLGGHFVQGHIDLTVPVLAISESGSDLRLELKMPEEFARYIAFKGSIAVNGVSLTVAELNARSFAIWIIPHTREQTNLGKLAPGDEVNIECDILAKYLERLLATR